MEISKRLNDYCNWIAVFRFCEPDWVYRTLWLQPWERGKYKYTDKEIT